MWQLISETMAGRSVILTTHSCVHFDLALCLFSAANPCSTLCLQDGGVRGLVPAHRYARGVLVQRSSVQLTVV